MNSRKDSQPLIRISGLSHRFPDGRLALNSINLDIEADSFTVICGENGSGKTVLMRHLNGILEPSAGEISVSGISVRKDPGNACRKIGFVFQNSDTQFVAQTVRDDIAFGPENLGLDSECISARVSSVASDLDIVTILEKSPHRLSGGEKKKAAIAGVLAMEPALIVFDEPFAGLDYRGVRMLIEKILKLRKAGKAVIVISHDLEKILAHADTLVVMADGRITGCGAPVDMLETAAAYGMRIPAGVKVESMSWYLDT
ncbi:MAG: ABC transporter ATP-binding protein [Spirochaetales bacterium]|uniref:ABC transporter ATP-binding protein n=1 Tax=Candidatus Thalassospirochaeta sargassi TaxID=3119039 RepID=A0AAJ1IDN2_9SPIO|nr:ABC transporter ATP-binding protein [Spirochaetales bacterium]